MQAFASLSKCAASAGAAGGAAAGGAPTGAPGAPPTTPVPAPAGSGPAPSPTPAPTPTPAGAPAGGPTAGTQGTPGPAPAPGGGLPACPGFVKQQCCGPRAPQCICAGSLCQYGKAGDNPLVYGECSRPPALPVATVLTCMCCVLALRASSVRAAQLQNICTLGVSNSNPDEPCLCLAAGLLFQGQVQQFGRCAC